MLGWQAAAACCAPLVSMNWIVMVFNHPYLPTAEMADFCSSMNCSENSEQNEVIFITVLASMRAICSTYGSAHGAPEAIIRFEPSMCIV